jgi:anti-sigma28 factor (negative regulator of flagellin synthesis)
MKTTRERAEEKREEKLHLIKEQIANGTLVVRKMTAEERQQYPPVPLSAPRRYPKR